MAVCRQPTGKRDSLPLRMAPGFLKQKNGFCCRTLRTIAPLIPQNLHQSRRNSRFLKSYRAGRFTCPKTSTTVIIRNPFLISCRRATWSKYLFDIPSSGFPSWVFSLMRLERELTRKPSSAELAPEKSSPPSKKGKRRHRRPEPMPTTVQRLFDTCKRVFADGRAGFVPSPDDVSCIRSILDNMKPSDVGVSPKLPYFRKIDNDGPPIITYLHVYECPQFSIGIFCLPPSAVIPLHNHPGMTVFSKLLLGSMHIKSYDWVVVAQESSEPSSAALPTGKRLAEVKTDEVFTAPCETSILYPASGGNMHCFTAKTACVVLDVLGPPYSIPERNCTYYYDYPYAKYASELPVDLGEDEGYAWLEERIGSPEEFVVVGAKYQGPKILEG